MPTLNTLEEGSTEPFLFMEAEVFFSILHWFLKLFYLSHEESVLIFSSIRLLQQFTREGQEHYEMSFIHLHKSYWDGTE